MQRNISALWTGLRSATGHPGALAVTVAALPVLIYINHPVVALVVGACIALAIDDAPVKRSSATGKLLLQTAIVLIGFSMKFSMLVDLSAASAGWVALFVVSTFSAGLLLGRLLGIDQPLSRLIAVGTAICGGTAIATLAPLVKARADQVGLALALVFALNAIAILAFPTIGAALEMTQREFGMWVAVAIHDTSSVVGAAAAYGQEAAVVATTVKLGRTLWLVPMVLAFSMLGSGGAKGAKVRVPLFVVLFVLAAASNALVEWPAAALGVTKSVSKALITCALFFVGMEFRRSTLAEIQGRVIWQAIGLWTVVVAATLAAVLFSR